MSSVDKEIFQVGRRQRSLGYHSKAVDILRPLAENSSPSAEVVFELAEILLEQGFHYDAHKVAVDGLQAVSPEDPYLFPLRLIRYLLDVFVTAHFSSNIKEAGILYRGYEVKSFDSFTVSAHSSKF
jgi:hypothetical protein